MVSSPSQLREVAHILHAFLRLPVSTDAIPGAFMEATLAHVHGAEVLNTYDFVDVVDCSRRLGWQVKSTKESTPVTWKRAKIPNREKLIAASESSEEGIRLLGKSIIEFCNAHVLASLRAYDLEAIAYARCVLMRDGKVVYFERPLVSKDHPRLFDPREFRWEWSKQKKTRKKEQLSALHGFHKPTGDRWWAWHGRGENQLHFSGERAWWPKPGDSRRVEFRIPMDSEQISMKRLLEMLA